MSKINLIVKREYLSRVRKKSFIVMTVIGPLLFAALLVMPAYLSTKSDDHNLVGVVDDTGLYYKSLQNSRSVEFRYLDMSLEEAREGFSSREENALLYIPVTHSSRQGEAVLFYRANQPSLVVQEHVRNQMSDRLERELIRNELGIDPAVLQGISPGINLSTIDMDTGKTSIALLTTGLGFFGGILIYFFIFIFGSQVMRGVLEEKTSRIVEVIVSSVRPFQLMMGKIAGVALVGLTQFLLWVVLTFIIVTVVQVASPALLDPAADQDKTVRETGVVMPQGISQDMLSEGEQVDASNRVATLAQGLQAINVPLMLGAFLFYFIFGYLLYGALFAAIGSAVDNEADTQQFMLPITVPLLLSIIMASFIMQSPGGPVAFWMSIIPFTSPVVMMIRIPFGVPVWEVGLSITLLILAFLGAVWLAGKIYHTGILMYGKKVTYRELWKWIRQSR